MGNQQRASVAGGRKMAVIETVRSILRTKSSQVWQTSPEATVFDAIAEMAHRAVGALPVMSQGRLVGIISERDYARKVILEGRSSRETPVQDVMTPSPVSVSPEHTVEQCMRIMSRLRIRYLPVVDQGILTGIVSMGDLVASIIATQAFTIDQLHTYIADTYPA